MINCKIERRRGKEENQRFKKERRRGAKKAR